MRDGKVTYRNSLVTDLSVTKEIIADSLVGGQVDLRFNPEWGATVQGVLKPPIDRYEGVTPTLSWAFVSYRPDDEWLFRIGKLRQPLFLKSQNLEVGASYDSMRQPVEIYSLSPVYDIVGALIEKTWTAGTAEYSLQGYFGENTVAYHAYNPLSQKVEYTHHDIPIQVRQAIRIT